jgi:hypothetical protein
MLMQLTPEDLKTENYLAPFLFIMVDNLKMDKE